MAYKKQKAKRGASKSSPAKKQSNAPEAASIADELQKRQDELSQQRQQVNDLIDKKGLQLLEHPDTTGLAAALKITNGQYVQPLKYSLQIAVYVKRHENDPGLDANRLPKSIEGIETDVIRGTYRRCAAESMEPQTFRTHPIGGCAIARQQDESNWGTLGIAVSFAESSMYVTNEHVSGGKGSVIYQPPLPSEPIPHEQWQIGRVFRSGADNNRRVDCALIESTPGPLNRTASTRMLGPDEGLLEGKLEEHVLREADERVATVFFLGAASGHESFHWGVVIDTRAVIKLPDQTKLIRQLKVRSLDGQRLVHRGDSGALLLMPDPQARETTYLVVGLVAAEFEEDDGSGILQRGLIANHFHNVRRALSFKKLR